MKKLLTTTEFVLWLQENDNVRWADGWRLQRIYDYADLMQRPLDFTTVKKYFKGVKHHKPKGFWNRLLLYESIYVGNKCIWYKRRKHAFFGKRGWVWSTNVRTIGDLVSEIEITPTPSLLKQIGI